MSVGFEANREDKTYLLIEVLIHDGRFVLARLLGEEALIRS
jgi:hypothetical protein